MAKPPLLYASPFPPQQSGISEYSTYLVDGLREFFDVTLFTEGYQISDARVGDAYPILHYRKDEFEVLANYPFRIYNIGNNPWFHGYIYESCLKAPGIVILHDAVIYFLIVGLYMDRPDFLQTVYRLEGARGLSIIKDQLETGAELLRYSQPQQLPFLGELLESGNQILVHSDYALQHLRRASSSNVRLGRIDMPILDSGRSNAAEILEMRECLGIPRNAVLLCSFGFVAQTKLNHLVCDAIERVRSATGADVHYVMVGEGNYVDDRISDRIRVTGYVPDGDYHAYMQCADLIVNIRYPSMGETSIALLRAMSLGKPCIVTNHAWFSELPDSVVLKTGIPSQHDVVGQLTRAIGLFMDNRRPFDKLGLAAAEYVRSRCSPRVVAERLKQYLL